MRSTMKISANTTLNNILKDYAQLFNVQNKMATGQRVSRPSDDPLAANEGLRLGTIISRVTQYNRNITTGNSFLGLSDGKLSNMSSLITSAKGLTVSSASETTTHEMRQANTVEIQSILQEIISLANAEEAGRYLFGGTVSNLPPYEVVGANYVYYRGNEQDIKIQTDSASFMNINTTGEDVFGSMTSTINSRDLSPQLIMGPSYATRLEDLNNGLGVPKGSINIRYSAYPDNGINIDLSECDTIDDVANKIKEVTRAASAELNPDGTAGSPISYLSKRYIKVELNEDGSGLSISETDDVWETTYNQPEKRPPDYPGFTNPSKLVVDEVGGSLVATRLGIKGTAVYKVDPLNIEQTIPQAIEGGDLDPRLDSNTLLADMEDYVDRAFTISNGALPSKVGILEITDTQNSYSDWSLNGLSEGINTDKDGELYIRTEETYSGSGEYYINIYKDSSGLDSELVAQGAYVPPGGMIELEEKNSSGVSGHVAMPNITLPISPVTIKATFDDTFSASISVPAYESTLADATYHGVMSEFRMRGMRRGGDPMSKGSDPCSYQGDFYVEIENTAGALPPNLEVTVYNANATPRSVIATGKLPDGLDNGMVELEGVGDFDYLTGSVYVDWENNVSGGVEYDAAIGYDMKATFSTVQDLMNEINASNTYTSARIAEDGKGLDIVSHLAGAHMIITENIDRVNHTNDYGQIGEVNLDSVIKGYNTAYDGKIYTNLTTEKGTDVVASGIGTLTVYTTTADLYNADPRDEAFDPEKNLVAQAKTEAALDTATGIWYQYDAVNDVWNNVSALGYPANSPLSINQTNNSGLSGTIELNSLRLPSAPYTTTSYFDYEAAAGEKDLGNAIVIDTNSSVFNESNSPDGNAYSMLEKTDLSNLIQGVNTDNDGNLQTTVGYKISADESGQVCKLDLSGIDYSANTDPTGKLHAVTSYAIENDSNNQFQQLQLNNFKRGKEATLDGKIYAEVDAGGSNRVRFYNALPIGPGNIVAESDIIPGAGGVININPVTSAIDSTLSGSMYIPAGAVYDSPITIDLERGSVMLYNDATLDPANLVATGNSDTTGEVTFTAVGGSGITGTSQFPSTGTDQLVQYDDSIVIDTSVREVILYAGEGYNKRVAKGEFPSYAGGEVELLALNNSKISGSLFFNTVIEDTDVSNQVQNLELDGIQIGTNGNTAANGMLYMQVVVNGSGWDVEIYDASAGGALVSSGSVDINTGIATLTDGGSGSGITGSVRIGNPPEWNPQPQGNAAGNRIAIDVGSQDPDMVIYPQRGLQNSGENREENIFTTLNDVMIGMNNDDVESLHDLLEKFNTDHNRVLTARADIGTRVDRLDMLTQRHEDELINFKSIRSENLDLDYSQAVVQYQMAQNVFDAALRTTAQIMPMSLVDYI